MVAENTYCKEQHKEKEKERKRKKETRVGGDNTKRERERGEEFKKLSIPLKGKRCLRALHPFTLCNSKRYM